MNVNGPASHRQPPAPDDLPASTAPPYNLSPVSPAPRGASSPPLPPRDLSRRTPDPAPPPVPERPRRTVLEILLDPRSIQWFLATGGVLLTLGLVIWLASLGFFANPQVVAAAMGAGTAGLLAVGWFLILKTRFELAGRAVTLLACLVMPLNLWFYHAQALLTLEGHLWAAALACCALYAASAYVLKDPAFAYVLCAGLAGTGLLILVDLHVLAQIAAPSTLLVALGLLAIHAERAFPADGPFARRRFGLAFFWSGHVLLAAGLLLVLGAQLVGWLWRPIFVAWGMTEPPAIAAQQSLRVLALVLIASGAYAYLYSDLVVRRVGWYVYAAAVVLLWAEVVAIDLLHLSHTPTALIVAMAVTALGINVFQACAWRGKALARPVPPLGLLLGLLPVLLGVTLHLRATHAELHRAWPFEITWAYVAAMVLTAIVCRASAALYRGGEPRWVGPYLFASAAALLVGAAGLLWVLGLQSWASQAPLLMLVPIAYLVAGKIEKDPAVAPVLSLVANAAAAVMIASVLAAALGLTPRVEVRPVAGQAMNLLMALFAAEAAVFYGLSAALRRRAWHVYAAAVMGCGALWQLLSWWHVPAEYYTAAFAAAGLALLVIERVATPAGAPSLAGRSVAVFRCANATLALAFVTAVLITLTRLAAGHDRLALVVLPAVLSVMSLVAAAVVRAPALRRAYAVLAAVEVGLALLALQTRLHLTAAQNAELFAVTAGAILLISGHAGWYREQRAQASDAVTFALGCGSLLAGLPLAIAFLGYRFAGSISLPDEIALITVSMLMFVSGMVCRIRGTTLVGGALLLLHLVMMLVFTGWRAQLAVGVYLAIGGGLLFATGVLLSIYRDRLLALPDRIRARRGIFKVLSWR